jgi:hypothetical protein
MYVFSFLQHPNSNSNVCWNKWLLPITRELQVDVKHNVNGFSDLYLKQELNPKRQPAKAISSCGPRTTTSSLAFQMQSTGYLNLGCTRQVSMTI